MSATINVSLLNAASAKTQQVTLPRDMTVADLQTLAGKNVTFSVDGCTPSSTTTLGDLYDMCAKQEVLEVKFRSVVRMGFNVCGPCFACGYEAPDQDAINNAIQNRLDDIRNSTIQAANDAASDALGNLGGGGNLGNLGNAQ